MKIKSHYIFVFAFVIFCSVSEAQTVSQLIKAGDKKFDEADYYAASLYYKDALKKDEDNTELNYKFAEASRMFNDYANASKAYEKVSRLDKIDQFPLALFWWGEMLRGSCVCKTDEALKALKRFRNKYHKKDFWAVKAQQEIEACSWVFDHKKVNDTLQIEHLGKEVNTDHSEFNAIPVYPDRLQYSALRNISDDKKNEKYLVRIYNQPSAPEKIYTPNGTNPDLNIGNGAYSTDSRKFFFTQCEQKDKVSTRCDIYVTRYDNFKWSNAEKLSINDPAATNTHPAPGFDLNGKEVLFFASDRSGGEGGLDIWVSKLNNDGSYGAPVNAGKAINTKGNEITPFFDSNNKKLFFSSDWHYGFGGYDIFETKGEYAKWSIPKNLLQPINTAQNDLYYTIAFDNSKAYLTSNRVGSYFIEAETCCNDIYAYSTGKKIEKKTEPPVAAVIKDTIQEEETTEVVDKDTTTKTVEVIPPHPDTIAVAKVEAESQKFIDDKVRNIKQMLPLRLYFHNDEPGRRDLTDTTTLDYKQTYEAYTTLQFEYMKEFSKDLKGEEKAKAEKAVTELFANQVDKGFYELIAFSSQLLDLLKAGNKIDLTIKGFCSPLHANDYNMKLGYRRVASLRNYFFHYRDGILLPYIAKGTLVLKSESFGKETAPKDVSDNFYDTRNSVYNPAAALERRVEIISVELK